MPKQPVYRGGRIHVCARMCDTCIFRPGNLMHLDPGRVEAMVEGAIEADSCIPCHSTLEGAEAVCFGFFTQHPTTPLQIAERIGLITFVTPPKLEE